VPDSAGDAIASDAPRGELTILMPCLDEAATLATCIRKARQSLAELNIDGEVLIADNGSTDGSREIAAAEGARVVRVAERGYGAALLAGIKAARGRFIIMGDADDSYAFDTLGPFVEALRGGAELVMGNRFAGGIAAGAMPRLHRYLGNPVLSFVGRLFFRTPIRDFHCGLRGFDSAAIRRLGLQTHGMEFASEMVIKATLAKLRIEEVATTLKPDGRNRPPHLRSWRDGWRHLRFMLLHSPRWLFVYPGLALFAAGTLGSALLIPGPRIVGHVGLDIHTLLYAATAGVIGLQLMLFGLLAQCTAAALGLLPHSPLTRWCVTHFRLEVGLLLSFALLAAAFGLALDTLLGWGVVGFSALDPSRMMRRAIPAAMLGITGTELMIASFWLTFLQFAPTPKPSTP
jgi:glycosyltransferase involved in cell wall biosynthesis